MSPPAFHWQPWMSPQFQPRFHFAAWKGSKHGVWAAVPVFFILFMTPKKTHFWLENKLEVSVETSNIFPESTIKTIRLCFNLKWFVQVFVAKPCYSFVYHPKNLKSTSKQYIFQKIKQSSLCWPKSQEELTFVTIKCQTNICKHNSFVTCIILAIIIHASIALQNSALMFSSKYFTLVV